MPYATAHLSGNHFAPNLEGVVNFFPWLEGTLVKIEVAKLPTLKKMANSSLPIDRFVIHINKESKCKEAIDHYNLHQSFLNNLPSLLSNGGYSYMTFYTNQFKPSDVISKTIDIHLCSDNRNANQDDNIGERIACGIIVQN
jgi:Cu-Zn family superoxide dismutase